MTLILSIFLLFTSVTSNESVVTWLVPTEHDFGDLKQDEPVFFDFRFKNTSDEAIVIDNVRTTCGCTAPDWSEAAIAPGEESTISIEFDAKKEGYFYKKITVFFSNQKKGEKLFISGYVE